MKTITRFESWYVYSDGVVRINDGVEKVPEWSFENMEGVKEIIIPDSDLSVHQNTIFSWTERQWMMKILFS